MFKRFSLFLVLIVSSQAIADHRAALLIDNAGGNLKPLAVALEKEGVRCKVVESLDEQKIRYAIEGFANSTPTRGTALVYFAGQVHPGSYKGKPGLCMLGTNSKPGRGYSIEETFTHLNAKGGSSINLVVTDAPRPSSLKGDLPNGCLFTFNNQSTLIENLSRNGDLLAAVQSGGQQTKSSIPTGIIPGRTSNAISPPDRFVQGKNAGDEWVNSMGVVFCWCPPGKYTAGSPEGTPGRHPDEQQREVIIKDGFWLSKYELTLSQQMSKRRAGHRTIARRKLDPATMINHDDAKAMTRHFSESERKAGRLFPDWQYSLPTEDQWEYAARAGTTTKWYFGDNVDLLPQHANFADKAWYDTGDVFSNAAHRILNDGVTKLARVGSYKPNPWGLHDMHGNVAEWCINTAIRGGSWVSSTQNTRIAFRHSFSSRNEQNFIGYRIVITRNRPEPKKKEKKK
jgi:formylglycine-generating enzyme required for sulfatase activity